MIITGGGTGGHIFPGIVIAKALIKHGWDVLWMGTKDRMESFLVPRYKINIDFISINGLRGKGLKSYLLFCFNLFRSLYKFKKIIKIWKPDIIFGLGSYISAPGGIISWISRIPLIIYEQNVIAGITNKLLAKIANISIQAFPGAILNSIVVGNPIRNEIISILPPELRLNNRSGPIRILVIGGSQGAKIFNNIFPDVLKLLKDNIFLWHQVGHNAFNEIDAIYKKIGIIKYRINDFIHNIAKAYAWADLVVCQSGAITVSELIAVGLPSILVPFEHSDCQQYFNALLLEEVGAGIICKQEKFNVNTFISIFKSLNRAILFKMSVKAKSLYLPGSLERILKIINSCV
ncbi:undecaprenyldiphospho-muramoylpentapeptide beta-N-acetylglucosaminyltransferase [Candidatus Purcelliella pentastirinorum]|uniref:undecaprenyldiphospho-muramoylpentapeptide beta-N-acetylglucosaminyltransferase n=1 Tax=Candidatus Purcelliella pentastirinorum TaxID=472834 RepID=UPI00237AD5A3|nr:undecaprenyldiphospho-muramoylpentapeptide beta-N-acetylglucosaminyltransferase [Candidatus Purcelliella pentastirinorum]WDR80735.1 undecaprenyldiphospho-muramoylpentapeptide beta-N-acetylglucosaminyltransferase [Candidatus Purcelliella pentastirinorum]